MSFFRKMKLGSSETGKAGPRTAVTVFGKHPGWDDHIDDIAIDTDLLGETKRWLYVEGIRAIVDHSAWDKLEPDQLLDEFNHIFYWRMGDDVVLGCLWSSRDGKGRSRYPMVICVHGRNLAQRWYFNTALPLLERMKSQFMETTSAAQVRAILDTGRAEMAAAAVAEPESAATTDVDPRALARLADLPEFNGEGGQFVGLQRVLYQVERDMAAFRPAGGNGRGSDKTSGEVSLRSKQMRVPSCGMSANDIVTSWLSVMAEQVTRTTPLLLVVPPGNQWCDLIVGTPSESNLRCLRTTPKATPLATDVPYTIEDEFAARVRQAVDASRAGDANAQSKLSASVPQSPEMPQPVVETVATREPSAASGGGGAKRSPMIKLVGIFMALVVLGAAAVVYIVGPQELLQYASRFQQVSASESPETGETNSPRHAGEATSPSPAGLYTSSVLESIRISDANWVAALRKPGEQGRNQVVQLLAADTTPTTLQLRTEIERRTFQDSEFNPEHVADDAAASRLAAAHEELRREVKTWLSGIEAAADEHEQRGWHAAAQTLRDSAQNVNEVLDAPARLGGDDGAPLLAAIAEATDAMQATASINELWDSVQPVLVSVQAQSNDDAVLGMFEDRVNAYVAAASNLEQLHQRVQQTQSIATALANAVRDHWQSGIDQALFRAESGLYPPTGDGLEVFELWASRVADERYSLLGGSADPRRESHRRTQRNALTDNVEAHRRCGALPADLLRRVQLFEAEQMRLDEAPWDGTRSTIDHLAQEVDQLEREAAELAEAVAASLQQCLGECERRLVEVMQQQPELDSPVLLRQWERFREQPDGNDRECQERLARANDVRLALESLSSALPLPDVAAWGIGEFNDDALAGVIAQHREAVIVDALEQTPLTGNGVLDSSPWRGQTDQYQQWLSDVRSHVQSLNELQASLAALSPIEALLEEYALLTQRPVHADVAEAAASVVGRIEGLREISNAPIQNDEQRMKLLEIVEGSAHPEQQLAAWRRLGQGGLHNPRVMEQELRSRDALQRNLATLGQRGREVLEEVAVDQARRWIEHVRLATDSDALAMAMRARRPFGIDHEDPRLDARSRFNIMLHSFSRRLAMATDESEQLKLIQDFREWARDNGAAIGAAFAPPVEGIVASLNEMESVQNSTEPDFSRIGPGAAGWRAEVLSDGEVIRFHAPATWTNVQQLVFRRVQPLDAPAAYVCTTEASIGLFLAAVEHEGQWQQCWSMLEHAMTADGRDHRRGARVWRATGDQSSPMSVALQWLQSESDTSYAPSLRVEKPRPGHPMQQISAAGAMYVANLLGCRLPTYREWHAAYLVAGGEAQVGAANLRRSAWSAQVSHFEQVGRFQAERPDEGGFELGRELHATWNDTMEGASAASEDVLWFRQVDVMQGAGPLEFRNLVGNVAEFVFNDPETLAGNDIAQKLRTLGDQQQADIYVVGGSSLSRPDSSPTELASIRTPSHLRVFSDVGFRLAFAADDLAKATVDRAALIERFIGSFQYLTAAPHSN